MWENTYVCVIKREEPWEILFVRVWCVCVCVCGRHERVFVCVTKQERGLIRLPEGLEPR